MHSLYPLKFLPLLKEKIWGGTALGTLYDTPKAGIGEAWLLSGYVGEESQVANGTLAGKTLREVADIFQEKLLGKTLWQRFGNNFPLLFKLIDAADFLSIQVHPDDATAAAQHGSWGKTEMWYVMAAEKESELIIGFKKNTTPEEYFAALAEDKVQDLLQKVKVQAGDAFFIPAGLVHAIGKGVMLAEIQQSSDLTY